MSADEIPDPLLATQRERNRLTRGDADRYRPHRKRVTALLAPGRGRLAVLGAGNANDLDLPRLLETYDTITLIDLDTEALAAGIEAQGLTDEPRIRAVGGVDVTGRATALAAGRVDAAPRRLALPEGPFDAVASVGLLTQLVEAAGLLLGGAASDHPQVVATLRDEHVDRLVELVAPGGRGWLVTELVSSDTAPALRQAADADLGPLAARWVAEGNFFAGCHPGRLAARFANHRRVEGFELADPWRWPFPGRDYLAYAIGFTAIA